MLILSRHLLSWYLSWSLNASYKIKTLTKDKNGSLLNYLRKYSHFKYFSGHITNFRSINITIYTFSSVQFSHSVMSDSLWPPWTAARQACLSITNSWSLPKLMSIELMMPSNHLILCCPLLIPPSIFSSIRVFSDESVLHIRWPKYWSFSFNISPSNEYSGWFPLGRTGWISLQSKGLSRVFSSTTVQNINSSALSLLYGPTFTFIHNYWKNHSFDYMDLCRQSNISAF